MINPHYQAQIDEIAGRRAGDPDIDRLLEMNRRLLKLLITIKPEPKKSHKPARVKKGFAANA